MVHRAARSMKDTLPLQAADMLAWETYSWSWSARARKRSLKYVPTCKRSARVRVYGQYTTRRRFKNSGVPDVYERRLIVSPQGSGPFSGMEFTTLEKMANYARQSVLDAQGIDICRIVDCGLSS